MKDLAVLVQGVGKRFDIGVERQRTLSQQMRYWVRGHQPTRTFWALKDISLQVKHGEALGVIGPNGSGKSTLLRILSGIYQPDEGHVGVFGPINPFLALGVSLLPQLTVLENLRLCAALLGYTGREFKRKLDSIIEFSELQDYLYAAVADLSAGWSARVSFSIAIHTNLNILLIDETLEVGDLYFQSKCKEKFLEIKKEGKTIVLISHSLDDVRNICNKTVYISGGRAVACGETEDVVKRYKSDIKQRLENKTAKE